MGPDCFECLVEGFDLDNNVKFVLNLDDCNCHIVRDAFNKAKGIFNWEFDEDFNAFLIDDDIDYQLIDVSNLEKGSIKDIMDSFFSFAFDSSVNSPLYKFLILKDNESFRILANISSLIFDYASIHDFYELFVNSNKSQLRNDLDSYYDNINDYLNSPDFEKDSAYWRNHLLNSSNHVKFYNLKDNECKIQIINVNEDSINDFISANDCSLFDFYGSVFSLYLSRIDRLDGTLLNTVISHKDEALGRNTLLKVDVNNSESFNDLIDEFKQAFVNAIENTKVGINSYLDENATYYSIYDFTDLNDNIQVLNGDNFALTLNIYKDCLQLVYNSGLFSDTYINHLIGNIESLIDILFDSPNQLIGDIDVLSDEEKALLSEYCRGKSVEVDKKKFLSHAFRENALNNPDAVAVDDGVNKITFGELERSSNSIANDLKENYGICPGSRVALMLMRDYHFPEMVLALNKIGATFVPIDLFYPIKRIEYMLNLSQSEYVVATKAIADSFDLKQKVICLEDLNDSDDADVEIATCGEDLFTIIFTSGTTGLPKGVMVSNSQIPGVGISFREIFNYSKGDVIGHYLGFTFVASFVIYAALYFGGCCRIFNEKEQKDSLLLIKELKEKHMNSLILPPGIGIPIYENEDLQLDYLVLAGAKLNELSKNERRTKLINFYGTTEIICGITKIYDLKDMEDNNVPLGRPVANTWVYILDDDNNQMPIGVPGEICVSNDYISPGYLNNQELTDEVFIENPFSDCEDNRIMYRTGDIGFYNFDGEIEIIGREDDQLSVRGFRIESDEILRIMNGFKGISDIYLDVDNDNLIAYYTTDDNLDINEVKKALSDELPYYMIPSLFIELDEIPLNINGKIDKSRLKTAINNEDIEIADEVVSAVADAFKEVLNLDFVLIDDDFVALGGNSLSAMKLQLALKEKLGVHLSSNQLISLSTPNEIANHIKFNMNVHSSIDEDNYTFDEPCPLSESQLNIYLDESVNDKGTSYNNPFKIDFKDDYSADEIKDALIKLFDVFPVLKAHVLNDDGDLSFAFDAEPEIIEGSVNGINSFVEPFEFDKCLSRFLIVENSLCADFHHLIFDGTSLNILLNRFISILNCEKVDFVDYGVLRQISFEGMLDSDYMDSAHEFFDDMLADRDEVHDLLSSVNNENDEFEFIDSFDIDLEHLNSFLQNHNLTHNQFFASVFAYTLSRFSASDKVFFNIIEDGRGHIDLSESVGMFVKTLPVLMDCTNRDVDSFLDYSSGLINSVMKYDLYPFRLLAKEYDLNSNVLFQYSHSLFSDVINEDLKFAVDELKRDVSSDLSFFILNNGKDKLTIRILYSSMYSKSFIMHFTESYKMILNGMTDAHELKDISYICDEDIELLDSYNQTEHPLDYDDILDAFNDNLLKYPENALVSYDGISYTYSQGAYMADAIAKRLLDLGVDSQDCVSFLVPRSELYMFSVLGIMSVGAVYVPLDDTLPDERIEFMLEDTKSKVLIASDDTYGRARDLHDNVLNISEIIKEGIISLSHLPVSYGEIASILYTSGTTGVPKGVRITRKAILNVAIYYRDTFGLSNDDVYGLYASIGFDAGVMSLFKAICAGSCLSVVPEEIRYNMHELNSYFIKENVTHTIITTPVGKLFMQTTDNTSLDYLFVGGEKLGKFPSPENYQLVDEYGPTEGNNFISSIRNSDKTDSTSIGYLNYNSKAYILDSDARRVPFGAVGELCLAGYQIADGYFNREAETAKSFVLNTFDDDEDYKTLYRTGDMVRLLPDGSLGIVGRRDGQIKVRGNRVEPSEVESVIRQLDYVSNVTVQSIKNGDSNELVAYVVLSDETDDIKGSVCDYVMEHKPDYMVPSFVVQLDEIPLTVNGKVDKRALPEVDMSSLHAEYVAPTNELEKTIVEAFEKVFDDKIGIYDDFVRLGGDSLNGVKLLSHLENYNITLGDVLSLRTPHAIADKIVKNNHQLDLNDYSLTSGCPLSEPQLNVYLDIMANDKVDSYLIPSYMAISKKYGVDEIVAALNRILDVHPILGMCVSDEFEVPYLVRGEKPEILVEPDADDDYIVEFLKKAFDLDKSLCRFLIVENDERYNLISSFHHIIFDAFSQDIFKHDLHLILDGKEIDVDDTFLKASSFAQQISGTEEYAEADRFYESMLEDSEDAGILLDSVLADGPFIEEISLDLDNGSLESFLDRCNVSRNVLFTSVFAYALSRFVGSDKVLFNIAENGRDRFGNFNAMGMFVNTLPILADCKDRDVKSFMNYMSDMVYDVMKYNYYPYRLLANKYEISLNVLFQYIPEWILDYAYYDEYDVSVLNAENSILYDSQDLISDFIVQVNQISDGYDLKITYSDKYSSDFVNHFLESYKLIVHEILDADNLGDINCITDADIEVLDGYNQTEHIFEHDDILDYFNDNLSEYPENSLVSFEDKIYSYGEGAYISKRIAECIADCGVESQDCVAFLLERCEHYMFCVLAILSSGCVYVPLDDKLPDERLQFMLEDSNSKLIIASDETYDRAAELASDDCTVLNISDIVKGDIGTSDKFDVNYGDLACILYTSGTTGVPKGVKITRRSLLNVACSYIDSYGLDNNDVYGLFSAIGFDVSSFVISAVICAGASLSVVPEEIRFNMAKLNSYFVRQNVSHAFITTQVGKLFMQSVDDISLDVLLVAGEKLGEVENPKNYRLIDAYGPTEAFAFVSSIDNSDKLDSSSVGMLNHNIQSYILDNERRRVPLGAVGELYLAGHQVADGYLNRPEENAKSFIPNPFDDNEDYGTLYATGDMVRILPDGSIGIVGRRDSQVKIRGNRLEISEVESIIREIDYVDDLTVRTVKHDSNNELIAYVVVNNNVDGDELKDSICEYVGKHKPDFMIPSFVIRLDEIPLNVNGKVDKRALPDVDLSGLHAEYAAPRNENERQIVEAFEKALDIEKVSIYDDFIRLGGDSLTAINLLSHIESDDVSMADIFAFRTPEAIAKNMSDYSFDLDLYSLESGCPLNSAQVNVFADVNVYQKVSSYHIPGYIPVPKEYAVEDILNALDELFEAHPILSMRVSDEYEVNDENEPGNFEVLKDLINTAGKLGISGISDIIKSYGLRNLGGIYGLLKTVIRLFKGEYPILVKGDKPPISVESNADNDMIVDFLSENFDLYDKLSKFMIVENDDSNYLVYLIHHIIFDATSAGVLKKDFMTLLDGGSIDYDDTFLQSSALTHQVKNSDRFDEAAEFYEPILSDIDDVGTLVEDNSSYGYNMTSCDLEFDKDAFRSFLNNAGISENVFFAGVFAYALSQFVEGDRVLYSMVENGRDRFTGNFIGMTSNIMPLVVDCSSQRIDSFMEAMADLVYGVSRHSYYPIMLLYQKYSFEVKILFQFVPNWIADDFNDFDDIRTEEIFNQVLNKSSDYLMELFAQVYQNGDDYKLIITNSNNYSEKMINDFKDTYMEVLTNMISADMASDIKSTLK